MNNFRSHYQNEDNGTRYMKLLRSGLLLGVLLVTLGGCKTTLKQNWYNFTAYYNTFYNANQNFEAGLKKVRNQKPELNPELPIRVYPEPVRAGRSDFEKAIEKAADILREHKKSKWVDDAILLIGRSYFYEWEYYNADQKFQELYRSTENEAIKQRSIFWRGRVFLEMDRIGEGIDFLKGELVNKDRSWKRQRKAKVQAVLADLYVVSEKWRLAQETLVKSLANIENKENRARAYFLNGQLLEKLDADQEAFESYKQVAGLHPFYDLVYHSKRKQAEVARKMGRHKEAFEVYTDMYKDDKNFDIRTELLYEIGRTQQARGKYAKAEKIYDQVLHSELQKPDAVTKAKSYYGLAQIYRHHHKKFKVAAAYYDSSSSVNAPQAKLPSDFDAQQMATSFGEYADLKAAVHMQDSLLWLAGLPQAKLDSVLQIVKEQKMEELEEQRKKREKQANTMVNVSQGQNQQSQTSNQQSGFLNHKNQQLVQQAAQEFQAVWGDRPLVDNWRRFEAIQTAQRDGTLDSLKAGGNVLNQPGQKKVTVQMDTEKIPFEQEEKEKMKASIAEDLYLLGNVFFLSLDLVDSAEVYYKKVIDRFPESEMAPQAIYSLTELYYVNNDTSRARNWAQKLVDEYPDSRFASRMAQRFQLTDYEFPVQVEQEGDTVLTKYRHLYDRLYGEKDTLNIADKAQKLRQFADNHSSSNMAPHVLMQAAIKYIEAGRTDSLYQQKKSDWFLKQQEWDEQQEVFSHLKDSAETVLQDSTISDSVRSYWATIQDSSLSEPAYDEYFPYLGIHWDSSRSVLQDITQLYPQFKEKDKVSRLRQRLKVPERYQEKDTTKSTDTRPFYKCEELENKPELIGGMDAFVDKISFSEQVKQYNISGTVTYEIVINTEGEPESFKQIGDRRNVGIGDAVETAIQEHMRFEPYKIDGKPVRVVCQYDIPFSAGKNESSK